MTRLIVLVACLIVAGAPLTAAAASAGISDPVPGHPGLTYLDLMKLVVTDLAATPDGASGHKVVAFRHIEGADLKADVEDTVTLGSTSIQAIPVPGRTDRVLVLADLGGSDGNVEEAELLGLFAIDPKPRLLDVVEVGNDRWTALDDTPRTLAPGSPLIIIDSDHDNSNENYNSTEMIFIRDDRFTLIDTLFTFSVSVCAFNRTQETAYATLAAPGPYRTLRVTVTETVKRTGDECNDDEKPPPAGVHRYSGTYRWNAARGRFEAQAGQLAVLEARNRSAENGP